MKKSILILLLIIFIALAFRIPAVLNSKSFWFDEMVSSEIAQKGILDSWQYLRWENNPPLHYWFLHYWIKIFGSSEVALRFSSVLFSLLAILAIYLLGYRLANQRVGLFAAFLLAISSSQLYLSADARMYPMLLFFAILSLYYFWQLLYHPKKYNWLLYIIFTLLAFYTHLTAFYLFFIQNLYFIYHYFYIKKQPNWRSWLFIQFIILAFFSPWLTTFILRSLSSFNSGAWYLNTQGQGFLLFQLPKSFLFLGQTIPLIELIGLFIFLPLFVLSFIKIIKWKNTKELTFSFEFSPFFIFSLAIFLIPLIAGFILQIWVTKYYLIGSLGFYLLIALGFNNLKIKSSHKIVVILLIFIVLLPYNLNLIKINQHAWQKVGDYISQTEESEFGADKILITAFVYELIFTHYYHGQLDVIAYQPQGLEDDLLLKTVKYNWYPILGKENMPDLNQILSGTRRIIVVNPTTAELIHHANLVLDWFVENNWRLLHKEQFGGFIQPTVFVFERPN